MDVSEAQVVATQAELLVGAGDVDSGASLASVFGLALGPLIPGLPGRGELHRPGLRLSGTVTLASAYQALEVSAQPAE